MSGPARRRRYLLVLAFLFAAPGIVLWFLDSDVLNFFVPVRELALRGGLLGAALALGYLFSQPSGRLRAGVPAFLLVTFSVFVYVMAYGAYEERELTFESQGERMSGTLYVPSGEGPHPAVVIAHGSIEAPRRIYHFWADGLVRDGVAVFSFDKRGTGKSGGVYESNNNAAESNLRLLASDVAAAIRRLSQEPDVQADRLGVVGISMGGWLGPIAAESNPEIAFLGFITGPTVSVGEENYYSSLAGDNGETEAIADQATIDSLVAGEAPSGFDPRPLLARLDIPAFWLFGETDSSIPTAKSEVVLDSLIAAGKPYRYRTFEGADHGGFVMGWPGELAPGFMDTLTAWTRETAAIAARGR